VGRLLATRVSITRIRVDGRADADAVATHDTPEGRAKNRRVEITLYVPGGEPAAALDTPPPPR
jgi:type VI secretion system protein ImpK